MQIEEGDGWGFAAHVYHYWVGYSILFQIVIGQLVTSALSFTPNLTMYIISIYNWNRALGVHISLFPKLSLLLIQIDFLKNTN